MEPRVALILTEMEQGFRIDVHTLMNLKGSSELTLSSLNKELQDKSEKAVRGEAAGSGFGYCDLMSFIKKLAHSNADCACLR